MKRCKFLFQVLYVSILVPIVIVYLLPLLQMVFLGDDKPYYNRTTILLTQIAVLSIALILILASYVLFRKGNQVVICYILGILISFFGIAVPYDNNVKFIESSFLSYVMIIGYCICVAFYEISALIKKKS